MCRQLAFHVMARGGAHEPAGFLGEQIGDGAGIVPLDRLAGQDDGAGIYVGGVDARIGVAAADEAFELVGVDGVVGEIRRANIRCEVDEPMSMPTVVSSTLSADQATSFSPGSTCRWSNSSSCIDRFQVGLSSMNLPMPDATPCLASSSR